MDSFDFDELILKFRYPILILLLGLIFLIGGIFVFKTGGFSTQTKVEVLQATNSGGLKGELTAEITGAVISPGVYKLNADARVDDLLIAAGGFSVSADRIWTDKYLNRAAKVTDGQKIYIPKVDEQSKVLSARNSSLDQTTSSNFPSDSSALININSASTSQLDSLPGIGPTYAQNIIEHRPYSTIQELVSKGAIKQSLLDKIKDRISIY